MTGISNASRLAFEGWVWIRLKAFHVADEQAGGIVCGIDCEGMPLFRDVILRYWRVLVDNYGVTLPLTVADEAYAADHGIQLYGSEDDVQVVAQAA